MTTKIVYVLTSTEKDLFYEQTLVSITSLRMHNPNAYVVLVVDEGTNETFIGFRQKIEDIITEKVVVKTPENYNNLLRSRYLKTTLREHIKGTFLYVDCDTIISSSLEEIDAIGEKSNFDILMAKDRHLNMNKMSPHIRKGVEERAKQTNWHITDKDIIYFNSGVMLVKDTDLTHRFFRRWNELWTSNIPTKVFADQPPLAKTNQEFDYVIDELDGTWNCQIASNALRYLHDAKIIHYFASNLGKREKAYLFSDNAPFEEIKSQECIPDNIMQNIEEPHKAYRNMVEVITSDDINFLYSDMHILYVYHRSYYDFVQKIASYPMRFNQWLSSCLKKKNK